MEITHRTNNLRIAPRKLRLVADAIRYQPAEKAVQVLAVTPNKGAGLLHKSLKSAIQVAKDNDLDPATLLIQRIFCDEGSSLKRIIPRSRGRATRIMKKSSHVSIVLTGKEMVRSKRPVRSKAQEPTSETTNSETPTVEGEK